MLFGFGQILWLALAVTGDSGELGRDGWIKGNWHLKLRRDVSDTPGFERVVKDGRNAMWTTVTADDAMANDWRAEGLDTSELPDAPPEGTLWWALEEMRAGRAVRINNWHQSMKVRLVEVEGIDGPIFVITLPNGKKKAWNPDAFAVVAGIGANADRFEAAT